MLVPKMSCSSVHHMAKCMWIPMLLCYVFSTCMFPAALLNTRQGELASACPLLEESGHGSLVHLLTPHADDGCIHLSCCSLAMQVVQQVQTSMLQLQQLALRAHKTSSQHCTALQNGQEAPLTWFLRDSYQVLNHCMLLIYGVNIVSIYNSVSVLLQFICSHVGSKTYTTFYKSLSFISY